MLRRLRHEHGQEVVEFAIILPLLLLLFFSIFDFGILIFSYDTISNAAREGARYGAVHPTDDAGIIAAARRLTTGLNQAALQINVTRPGGNTIRVEAVYDVDLITGFVMDLAGGRPTLRVRSVSTMQIE
jgi:Flp pilus assembly protein TadG